MVIRILKTNEWLNGKHINIQLTYLVLAASSLIIKYMCLDQESGEQMELKGEFLGEVIIKKEKIHCFK